MDISIVLIVLLVGALVTYLSGNKFASKIALVSSIAAFGATVLALNAYQAGENLDVNLPWISQLNINFALHVDGLSLVMLLLTTGLLPLIILSGFITKFENSKSIYALMLFMGFAMAGTFLASDGFLYYIFWEIALIPIYFIALNWGNGDLEERKKAILKFFIYTFAGSLFMLLAFIYLYTKGGSFDINKLYALQLTHVEKTYIFFAFFLAYAIKIPLIPFHTWQANTYSKAPAVGTMLLSGIMLKMGLYSVLRWQLPLSDSAAKEYMPIILALSIAGIIYGAIVTLKQKDIKKFLAYSSLSHVGLIAAGLYSLTIEGFQGAVLQMLSHGIVIVGLFYVVELIYSRYNTYEIKQMGGIRIQDTYFASLFMIIMLASVALPTTFNFIGEFNLLYSLFKVNIWYAVIAGTTIILGAFYMLRMFQKVMLGSETKTFHKISKQESIVLVIVVGLTIFFGLFPQPIIDLITPSLQSILTQIK
ncbi:NADH-quinone oxidoreductase subunit M [Flavobacterium sp. F372]|uniref:NADH-quinone oxidoreductase subunit M n=1 Tax=Flavobacterium bernardetii TaxID=2813823 RepID=A0ABR7J105_9FLAO|nr:NADH-quinone oxidoreductase subunit M [Flavobacterium bernardetii]MBC5835587.1 NADH-quinone oxidoreductase subunit M [Flavobacterium bernardetii]NHF70951.1 NADH-quinone oxidoreductase subunit M [Flavobacterium bernardetii]